MKPPDVAVTNGKEETSWHWRQLRFAKISSICRRRGRRRRRRF